MGFNRIFKGETASELFEKVTQEVMKNGETVTSRVGGAKHITNVNLELTNPRENMVMLPYRKVSKKYLKAEIEWYKSANPSADYIKQFAKLWGEIADENGNVNSNYGYLIKKKFGFNQWDYIAEKLRKNIHDRQAVLHFKWAQEDFGQDTPCTLSMQFVVINNKLEAHVYMRSNDAFWGFCNDIVWFTMLHVDMLEEIQRNHPEVELGSYFHTVGDFHIYEKDWNKIPTDI